MTASTLPARDRPLRVATPANLLADMLTQLAATTDTGPPVGVLQFDDGELITDVRLTGPQAAAIAKAVHKLLPPPGRPGQ